VRGFEPQKNKANQNRILKIKKKVRLANKYIILYYLLKIKEIQAHALVGVVGGGPASKVKPEPRQSERSRSRCRRPRHI
jgi:hypothetical protein